MSDQFFWYVTRSAAIVCWVAAALSIIVGLTTSSRLLGRRPTIPWLVDVHRMLSAVSVTFLVVHLISLVLDSYAKFRLADLLIPWTASVPGLTDSSIAWGVIAAWCLITVQLSSLMKDWLNDTLWHTIHLLSFGTLGFGTLHAVQAGSDIGNPIVSGVGVSLLTAIALAIVVRLRRRAASRRPVEEPATVTVQPEAPIPSETWPPAPVPPAERQVLD